MQRRRRAVLPWQGIHDAGANVIFAAAVKNRRAIGIGSTESPTCPGVHGAIGTSGRARVQVLDVSQRLPVQFVASESARSGGRADDRRKWSGHPGEANAPVIARSAFKQSRKTLGLVDAQLYRRPTRLALYKRAPR